MYFVYTTRLESSSVHTIFSIPLTYKKVQMLNCLGISYFYLTSYPCLTRKHDATPTRPIHHR